MGDQGLVVANDFKYQRTHVLRSHLDRLGMLSVLVSCYHGQAFPLRWKFDRVLLDPPCSGEGTYRAGRQPTLNGNPRVARHLVRVQKELLQRALAVLRPGGTLVYSTCTYDPEENEAVVDEAHKLSYDETLTELIREARKYGVGILLASQSVKDFDRIVFDMVGAKVALQLEEEDAKVMAENLGLTDKNDRDMARTIILHQPPHRGLVRSNHFEPYIQADITPFWKKRHEKI
jgi:hypothetical protein